MSAPSSKEFRAGAGLTLACLAAAAGVALLGRDSVPAWQALQRSYAATQADFEPGLRAAPMALLSHPAEDGREYCSSCHLAGAGYQPLANPAVFAAHPEVGHDPLELGCTPCHKGDPGSLDPHGQQGFGIDRPLSGTLAWTSCLHCHDPQAEPELLDAWPQLASVRDSLEGALGSQGCLGCHRARGRGGLTGPQLHDFGTRIVADPTAAYESAFDLAYKQLERPQAVQAAARMPLPDLEPQERELLAAWLSLVGHLRHDDPGPWNPDPAATPVDAQQVYSWFCSGCHGEHGQGRERGQPPGAIPALASELWLSYLPDDLLLHTIREGRAGSLMEGFCAGEPGRDDILSEQEVQALTELLTGGALLQRPDRERFSLVAHASCSLCHFQRTDYLEGRSEEQRRDFLREHPWSWELQDWLEDEGFEVPSCLEPGVDEEGQTLEFHSGEELYEQLCVHCHQDWERGAPGREPAAPRLRGLLELEHVDAGYLLASVVVGRSDAPATQWRHQGITAGEYSPAQLVCLARWLEENP